MITLRRADEGFHAKGAEREHAFASWQRRWEDRLDDAFWALDGITEEFLAPGDAVPSSACRDTEIVTYVRDGALVQDHGMGCSDILQAGEFQRVSAGRGIWRSEANASQSDWAHYLQIWLRPWDLDLEPSQERKRFFAAERRGILCVIASPDGQRESLHIHQDALIYSDVLRPGQHVVHELAPGRAAWLHIVEGEATLGEVVLTTGDGAGLTGERAVSLTPLTDTEILLIELNAVPPMSAVRS